MSEKRHNFCQNSIIYHVCRKRHKFEMRISLHAVFNVASDNVYFVMVFFNIHGRKMRFSESSQNFISEKPIFGHFEVIFLNI